ncbi:MAG: 50S ribosomal protein L24 [Parachlamydiales bacterium]|jgi:large subunit ribosomal protein L24
MSKWIKKNDRVVVITGNDKGKAGLVLARKEDRVVVQGINLRKKHMKRNQQTKSAQIVEMEMPIHISNVAFCTSDDKPIKAKIKLEKEEKKLIYFDNGKEVVLRTVKQKDK